MRAKPSWLQKKIDFLQIQQTQQLLKDLGLNTVCNHAMCPNIGECYRRGVATFLILGHVCTRNCAFCNIAQGQAGLPDAGEVERIVEAVARLRLRWVVITSVTRDDLPDGGAAHFAAVVSALRAYDASLKIELLIPDFAGSQEALQTVLAAAPDVIGHNIETVPSLYHLRKGASYARSISVLAAIARNTSLRCKSGLMLGLGESDEEIYRTIADIRNAGTHFLSIGQYLQPSRYNATVVDYVSPEKFDRYGDYARNLGFLHVESAPYVRSSYKAENYR